VELGHHDVQKDEVDWPRPHLLERLAAALGGDEIGIAAAFEAHRQREPVVLVVVDDQNDRVHQPLSPRICFVAGVGLVPTIRYSRLRRLPKNAAYSGWGRSRWHRRRGRASVLISRYVFLPPPGTEGPLHRHAP